MSRYIGTAAGPAQGWARPYGTPDQSPRRCRFCHQDLVKNSYSTYGQGWWCSGCTRYRTGFGDITSKDYQKLIYHFDKLEQKLREGVSVWNNRDQLRVIKQDRDELKQAMADRPDTWMYEEMDRLIGGYERPSGFGWDILGTRVNTRRMVR